MSMNTSLLFYAVLAAMACERVAELLVSTRNARWSLAHGGVESGHGHYPAMVLLHLSLFVGCVVEVKAAHRPFVTWVAVPALIVVLLSQVLRWWCISTLGHQWSTRVIVVPDLERVVSGPYRWWRHPNYAAVAAEGLALPLIHSAWITAIVFSVLNFWLLKVRLGVEERALAGLRQAAA